jgi:hypothetical protein
MRIAKLGACSAVIAVALAFVSAPHASQRNTSSKSEKDKHAPLNSFYIVTLGVAPPPDDTSASTNTSSPSSTAPSQPTAPAWRDTIVDVLQDGTGIRIREIAIEPAIGPHCPPHAVIARARERALPGESVDAAAGHHHLCSMNASEVAGVISAATKDDVARENSDDFGTQTIVATCGENEHLFELPWPDTLRFHALGLADSHITALWKLAHEVVEHAFDDTTFASSPPTTASDDTASQQLAEKLVPEIRSGRYASGFGDSNCAYASCRDHSAASALQGYAGVLDPATCAAPAAHEPHSTPNTERGTNDR